MLSPLLNSLQDLGADSRRLLHGRGGRFPRLEHLAIDWYSPCLLITRYAEGSDDAKLLSVLQSLAKNTAAIQAIIVQDRHRPGAPKQTIFGELPAQVFANESGLRYHLALGRNQNHGFFPDMKSGRDWLRANASGKRVLNLFAYTCSLSVAAIAGGAESVVNLDMASGALSTGRKNHQLNFDTARCRGATYLAHDLFKSWGKLKRLAPFDLIIADPPSNQTGSFVTEKDYPRMAKRLAELTEPQGQLLACLNAPHLRANFLTNLFADWHQEKRLPTAPGFEDIQPEAGLKCLLFSQHR